MPPLPPHKMTQVSHGAHFAGAITGFCFGVFILYNLVVSPSSPPFYEPLPTGPRLGEDRPLSVCRPLRLLPPVHHHHGLSTAPGRRAPLQLGHLPRVAPWPPLVPGLSPDLCDIYYVLPPVNNIEHRLFIVRCPSSRPQVRVPDISLYTAPHGHGSTSCSRGHSPEHFVISPLEDDPPEEVCHVVEGRSSGRASRVRCR